MEQRRITALLIEDNEGDAFLIRRMIEKAGGTPMDLATAGRLAGGLERLDRGDVDVVLLDLGLPDSAGLDTVRRTRAHAPDVPIIVLTGHDDEVLGANVVWAGAQDYLVKGQVDATLLTRAIRYAVSRQSLQQRARGRDLRDELTGLHSRTGFLAFAEQQLRLAERRRESVSVVVVRVRDLAQVRAEEGVGAVERLLLGTARLVRGAVRAADVVGRIDHDEFAILAADATADEAAAIVRRLRNQAHLLRQQDPAVAKLALVMHTATWEPATPHSAEELLEQARRSD
ncbi:MAG: response regulator [Planctomycetota bacterium]